jgi:hypothetical protein
MPRPTDHCIRRTPLTFDVRRMNPPIGMPATEASDCRAWRLFHQWQQWVACVQHSDRRHRCQAR